MAWVIGFLTFILIVDCLLMILLVLVQLPKKEAGMGQAFGGGATDALFGAGSGNALTKMTKYATAVFFVLTLSLSILNAHQSKAKRSLFERELQKASKQVETPAPAATAAPLVNTSVTTSASGTNVNLLSATTNKAAVATTNQATPAPASTNLQK